MHKIKKILILFLFISFEISIYALTAKEIIDKVDYNMSPLTVEYEGEMIIHKKNKIFKKKMKIYGKGNKLSFIEFTYPPRDKGTKYLRKENNLWMYLPKANKTIKISGHMLRQNMMGSDISYEDQTDRGRLNDNYTSKIIKEDENNYTIELIAIPDIELTYYRRVITVNKTNFTLKNSLLYAKSGKLLKEATIENYEMINNRFFATKIRMKDKIRNNSETYIIAKNIKLDKKLPESIFTLKNLERHR